MKKHINTKIKDCKGKYYHIGDIVYNTSFGDLWLVGEYKEEDIKKYNIECKYYLAQYGDKEDLLIDLDEPEGFMIVKRYGDKGYTRKKQEMLRYKRITDKYMDKHYN